MQPGAYTLNCKLKRKLCSRKLQFSTNHSDLSSGCAISLSLDSTVVPNPKGNRMELKNIKSFPPREFKCYISFEVSIPAPHTQPHALNGQFKCNQSTTQLLFKIQIHPGMAVSAIRASASPPTYLKLFVCSFGQFSSQSVQSLFDRAVH